jgi:NADH dehydrogenase
VKVFLTGATGFVGSHLATRLLADGHEVRALVRNPDAARGRLPEQMELVRGDVVTGDGIADSVVHCDAIIHLVGIIMEVGGATFENAHFVATRNIVVAAQAAEVRRIVQMSALGVRADGVSGYQTTKWRAEELVRASQIPYCILRPSIIFGPRDGFVNQMVDVMKSAPLVRPVPGNGRYPFRPVYIDNVVDCFAQALSNDRALGQTIDLVGPEELTLETMLAEIAACVGVRKPALKVPYPILYMNAAIMGAILSRPPVTTDQLRMLREGSTADPGPMLAAFKLNPVGFREGLKKYLCRPAAS